MTDEATGPTVQVATHADGNVYLRFSGPTQFFGLPPDAAVELGTILIQQAAIAVHGRSLAEAMGDELKGVIQ